MSWAHNKILITTINTTINFLYKVAHTNRMLFNGSPAETEARRREEVKRGRLFMRLDMAGRLLETTGLLELVKPTGACLILSAVTRQ